MGTGIMGRLIDPHAHRSVTGRARQRRWAEFTSRFPDVHNMRVLDLGGTPPAWRAAPVRPAHVTTVNLAPFDAEESWIHHVEGDACDPPQEILQGPFDLVFSNSLLEHVGGQNRREAMARTATGLAPRLWIQTPYRYFPVEPHWLFPGMQWLPHRARVAVSEHWHFGHIKTYSRAAAEERVNEVELIGVTQMRNLFPEAEIWRERFGGLTKSLVAVKSN